jgi:hypothetical protein
MRTTEREQDYAPIAAELDALLKPSLQDYQPRTPQPEKRPWQLSYQVFVAFFGGVLSATLVAYLNGRALRLSRNQLLAILAAGLVGFLATIVVTLLLGRASMPEFLSPGDATTLASRAIALLTFLAFYRLQKPADRVYAFFGGEYGSILPVGLMAIFGLGFVQWLLVKMIVAALAG